MPLCVHDHTTSQRFNVSDEARIVPPEGTNAARRSGVRTGSWMYMDITTVMVYAASTTWGQQVLFHGLEQVSAMMEDTVWCMNLGAM